MRPIDGDKLMMHLTDWWYSSFGQTETEESKAIKTVMDKIEQTLGEFALENQEQAENEWCPDCAEYDKENHCCHRFTKVIRQTVEECKREWANEGWIPVIERLPEDDTEVFVYLFDTKTPYIAWIYDGIWYTEEFRVEKQNEPIAWRPLPEPYTEDKE